MVLHVIKHGDFVISVIFCIPLALLFLCFFEAVLRPGQHFFSRFGRLPGFNQY